MKFRSFIIIITSLPLPLQSCSSPKPHYGTAEELEQRVRQHIKEGKTTLLEAIAHLENIGMKCYDQKPVRKKYNMPSFKGKEFTCVANNFGLAGGMEWKVGLTSLQKNILHEITVWTGSTYL